jgi:hypothetical protein
MKTKKIKIISVCILLLMTLNAESKVSEGFSVSHPMGLTGEFTCLVLKLPDAFLGGSVYYPLHPYKGFSCYSSFVMRAGRRTVFEKTGVAEYTQFKERRFILDFGIDESISFSNQTGFYARGGLGLSHGWYKGSEERPSLALTPTFQAGAFVSFDSMLRYRLRVGYTYANTGTSGPHGISVSLQFGGKL